MSVRSVIVRLEAEVAGYIAGMAKAASATDKTANATVAAGKATAKASQAAAAASQKHKAAAEEVGRTATVAGLATVAGVGLAVKSYADFDKQMSSVNAATHETAGNMDLLRQAAVDAGADTAFSAVEAAQGIEELAKAGVSTKDILAGGLGGSLDLAAAGALGVGEAAEIAASALTQFKLSGDQVPHLADLLAAGAGKAQGSVQDLGAALNQSGLVASATGATIEETTGALAAFASAGLTGSDAGTSFKTMLMSLNPNSAAAASLMNELGISAYDAQGNFVGMSEYAGILQGALKGMSDEQRNATLKTLFGTDAVRAANVMYEQGEAGIQKWEDAVNDAGYAAETAALMQDNLAGDLEKLGGAFDTVLIQSGSGANESLRGLVQGLESLVDAVGKVPAPVLSAGLGVAGLLGGAALLAGGLITVIPKIRDTRDAFNELAPAGGKARNAIEGVGRAAGGAATLATLTAIVAKLAESDYLSKIDTGMGRVAKALAEVTTNSPDAASALDSLFKDRDGGNLINGVDDLNTAMQRTFNKNRDQEFNDWAEGIVNGMTGVDGSSQILEDAFGRVDDSLASMVSSGKAEDAAKAFRNIEAAAKIQGASVEELAAKFPAYNDALAEAEAKAKTAAGATDGATGALKGAGEAAGGAVDPTEEIAKALEDVGVNADGTVGNLAKFTEALLSAGLIQLSARDAARNWSQALLDLGLQADGTGGQIGALGTEFDNTTAQGIKNQAMFDGVAQAGIRNAQALADNGASQKTLQGNLTGTYNGLIAAAGQFGITGDEAVALTRKVLGVPPGVSIKSWMSSEAKRMAEATGAAADAVNGKTVNVYVNTHETTFQRVVRELSGAPAPKAPVGVLRDDPSKAAGGAVYGPGISTSDEVPHLLSPGEHVFDAGDVIKMGGQQAVYKFRQQLQADTFQGLAGGGAVGHVGTRAPSSQLMVQGGAAPRVSLEGMTVLVTNPFTGEQVRGMVSTMAHHQAVGAIAAADSQTKYSRKGR